MNNVASMTGFGSAEKVHNDTFISVVIRSVNNRYLEVGVRVPPVWQEFETGMRRKIQQQTKRGKVELVLFRRSEAKKRNEAWPQIDKKLLNCYKEVYAQAFYEVIGVHTSLTSQDVLAILQKEGVVFTSTEDVLSENKNNIESSTFQLKSKETEVLWQLFDDAFSIFSESRKNEGVLIVKDLERYTFELRNVLEEIKKGSLGIATNHLQKLQKRVQEILGKVNVVDENRMLQEVALIADRYDLSEEIQRFDAHLQAVDELVKGNLEGKKLDFLCQELGREANTITSKASNVAIQHSAVEAKGIIEKLREQAQNIE
jgi:uncharacterized protein (TIGR00255 family)